jgi:hypothetical protein
MGVMWALSYSLVISYTIKVLFYMVTFFIFSQLFGNVDYLKHIPLFFQIVFVGYCIIYIWEIITWNHLPNSRLFGIAIPIPTGVFFNENNSAVVLLLISPFLTVKTLLTKSRAGRYFALLLFVFMIASAIIQSSRIALFVMLVLGVYYFFKSDISLKIASILIIILGCLIFYYGFPAEYKTASLLYKYESKKAGNETKSYLMTSSRIRGHLNLESLKMAWNTGFIGIGAGNYEEVMQRGPLHNTAWILNPHNWWLELLASFGLLITLAIGVMYFKWLFRLWRLQNAAYKEDYRFYNACFVSLLMFLPLSIVPSSIRSLNCIWMYFGFIHAVCLTHSIRLEKTNEVQNHTDQDFNLLKT